MAAWIGSFTFMFPFAFAKPSLTRQDQACSYLDCSHFFLYHMTTFDPPFSILQYEYSKKIFIKPQGR